MDFDADFSRHYSDIWTAALRLHAAFAPAPASHLEMNSPPPLRWWEKGRELQNMKDVCGAQDFLDEMVRTLYSWSVLLSALLYALLAVVKKQLTYSTITLFLAA